MITRWKRVGPGFYARMVTMDMEDGTWCAVLEYGERPNLYDAIRVVDGYPVYDGTMLPSEAEAERVCREYVIQVK